MNNNPNKEDTGTLGDAVLTERQIKYEKKRAKKAARKQMHRMRTRRKYGITDAYSEQEESIIRVATIVLKKRGILVLLAALLVGLCLGTYYYIQSQDTSKSVMMLNYEESSKGLAPNGTRFNINELTSDEVMNDAILLAGKEGQITAGQLSKSLGVYEVFVRRTLDGTSYYIPTSYRLIFNKPDEITGITSDNLLALICRAYKDRFLDEYTVNSYSLKGDYSALDSMEYTEIGAYFKLRTDELDNYLSMRNSEGGKFSSDETGETFNSLSKMVTNLKTYALENYNAYIWENGIVRYSAAYQNTLSYLCDVYTKSRTEYYNEYTIRRDVIEYFSNQMSTSILIPTTRDGSFYMARTQTGVDHLANTAEYYLDASKSLDLSVAKNFDRLAKMQSPASAVAYAKANEMIEYITTELNRIEDLAVRTDNEFVEENSRDYITFEPTEPSITDRLPLKKMAAVCGAFFAVCFFIYYQECKFAMKRSDDQ